MKFSNECPRCLMPSGGGECQYCRHHDRMVEAPKFDYTRLRKYDPRKYDCLIPLSGGFDSSAVLLTMVKDYDIRPLVVHFDNGWNRPEADHNIKALTGGLGVDLIRYRLDYDDMLRSLLLASVPDADIANDLAIAYYMRMTCVKYGIKYILSGQNFREEGTVPLDWTYMDARYLKDIHRSDSYPYFTFSKQLKYALRGIKYLSPLNDIQHNLQAIRQRLIEDYAWQDFGDKHTDNMYSAFVNYYLLPRKFGIDKRIVHLSAQIRSGIITKDKAREILSKPPRVPGFILKEVSVRLVPLKQFMTLPVKTHKDYRTYNFRRYRPVMWILYKLKAVNYNFYRKYCI